MFGGAGGRSKELSAWRGCSVFSSGRVPPLTTWWLLLLLLSWVFELEECVCVVVCPGTAPPAASPLAAAGCGKIQASLCSLEQMQSITSFQNRAASCCTPLNALPMTESGHEIVEDLVSHTT